MAETIAIRRHRVFHRQFRMNLTRQSRKYSSNLTRRPSLIAALRNATLVPIAAPWLAEKPNVRNSPSRVARMNEMSFAALMDLVRTGDELATSEIMQRYGAEVRRIARVRLRHGKLRRVLESSDILQSVMGSFFRRADHGEYEDRLSTPDELLRLLATMVRFKVIDQVRRAASGRRGGKFDVVELIDSAIAPSSELSPDQQLIQSELIDLVKDVMTTEEWELWRLRHGDNLEWAEIAQKVGGSPEANRKRLERLQERLRVKFADQAG
jgi:RNA polymerase sigma factor (sigma-70 family)